MSNVIAKHLLSIGAVKFSPNDPFTYASGLKGPIYCDNRMILSHVEKRNDVIAEFLKLIEVKNLKFDLLGGIATAGIPHAAFIADKLQAPMVYIRPKAKGHGKKNQVEGDYAKDQLVLLFEDLVNQGSSLEETMLGIKESGLRAQCCLSIVDYEMQEAKRRLNDLGIKLYSLTNFTDLVETALDLKLIDDKGRNLLIEWHADPVAWSKRFE